MKNATLLREKVDDLIYDLIFSKKEEYEIIVSDYILDIYTYDKFIINIKRVLKKSKVKIINEKLTTTPTEVLWKINIKK